MNTGKLVAAAIAISLGILLMSLGSEDRARLRAEVFKTATCNCCSKWVSLFGRAYANVQVHNLADLTAIKNRHGVPMALRSCHTTVAAGYVFEGHVPIDLLQQVLAERPKIVGLAVPGMPVGSPGMEIAGRKDAYKVVAFNSDGTTHTYADR